MLQQKKHENLIDVAKRQFSSPLDQKKSKVREGEIVTPNPNLLRQEETVKESKDIESFNTSTASVTLCKTQLSVAAYKKVSREKNSNDIVISSGKFAAVVPQLARKKSRIFEDLPKLFESSVPENQTNLVSMTGNPRASTMQLQEG